MEEKWCTWIKISNYWHLCSNHYKILWKHIWNAMTKSWIRWVHLIRFQWPFSSFFLKYYSVFLNERNLKNAFASFKMKKKKCSCFTNKNCRRIFPFSAFADVKENTSQKYIKIKYFLNITKKKNFKWNSKILQIMYKCFPYYLQF